eukprot:CAMPEP_0181188630 /NCGR_PEP_ID=MMETSP1096-20121128/11225_1 /TAXON_ID=156174 ORGANISM="Chrysochromulina ericina, Strain CCMP281" /NCGR_SAMPLE_ID=MMETSP1096 /ASSEMBLY_ACC=CAM_ASM_000453 /LENGTH=115 /DNA_ID=CAMNT_0023277717 /DNA_START=52 /DNA_END=396 /DNA_ORIENTATION=+
MDISQPRSAAPHAAAPHAAAPHAAAPQAGPQAVPPAPAVFDLAAAPPCVSRAAFAVLPVRPRVPPPPASSPAQLAAVLSPPRGLSGLASHALPAFGAAPAAAPPPPPAAAPAPPP